MDDAKMSVLSPSRLLNLDEAIPSEFYIFVNLLNPVTAHNFGLNGSFASAGISTALLSDEHLQAYLAGSQTFLPYVPRQLDTVISPFVMSTIADYSTEYDADYWRFEIDRRYPSRMSALYAFADLATCELVSRKYAWSLSEVRKFRLRPSPLNRVVKVNMEVVSLMRRAKRMSSASPDDVEHVWRHYWGGQGEIVVELPGQRFQPTSYASGVIWEYLIEGVVQAIPAEHS